jgi:phosphatidylserine decarboxylase
MTAVAALNVGDIVEEPVLDENACAQFESLKTNRAYGLKRDCTFMGTCSQVGKKFLYYSEKQFETPRTYKKGDPFGHFNFGSTIVLLFEVPKEETNLFSLNINDRLKVGEAIYM